MSSSLGDTIRKDKDYKHEFKFERWMETEYDDGVENYHKMKNGNSFVKLENDEGIDNIETSNNNRTPLHLGALILRSNKKFLNHFIKLIDGIKLIVLTWIQIDYKFRINFGIL